MVSHILDPLFFGRDTGVLGWQNAFGKAFCEDRSLRDLVEPFYSFGEDFGVCGVPEVACVYAGCLEGVGGGYVDAAAGEGVFL